MIKHYNNNFNEQDTIHIRANLLEIGRAYYLKLDKRNDINSVKNVFDNSFKNSKSKVSKEILDSRFFESIRELYYDKVFDYHILDLYYWENRMGRWFSEVLNETDTAFETFLPFNVRSIIDISLSFGIKERREDYMFKELINRNYPILNFYGENEVKNIYEQARDEKKSIDKIFDVFNVYDESSIIVSSSISNYNTLYIPVEYLKANYYSEVSLIFSESKGCMNLTVINTYMSSKAKGYLIYQLLINDQIVLEEDISLWNLENNISLFGLTKGDSIKIQVKSLRDVQLESWQTASNLKILHSEQFLSDIVVSKKVTCTSPFSVVYGFK